LGKSSIVPAEAKIAESDPPAPSYHGLLTGRIITLLDLLRRSGTMAHRREFGLSGMEWRIMTQVGDHAPLSLNELADLLILDRGQLSRAVKAMVARGLLDRRRRPGGPAIVITLSEEGKTVYTRMTELAFARNSFLVQDIAPEEIDRVMEAMNLISARATMLLETERSYGGGTDADEE